MISKNEILERFTLFTGKTGGIDSWLSADTNDLVFGRLGQVDTQPLSKAQFNQLLLLAHEAGMSDDFFSYYWLETPENHPYNVSSLPKFNKEWIGSRAVQSLDHLYWGLYRLYIDALLFFGNIRTAYRTLRIYDAESLHRFFSNRRFDTVLMKQRGSWLTLKDIAKDNRYLIAEMACKSYDSTAGGTAELKRVLQEAYADHQRRRGDRVTAKELLSGEYVNKNYADRAQQFLFSADDMLDSTIDSKKDLDDKFDQIAKAFANARQAALINTQLYLSMVEDLDVYVATSMRTRQDFRSMADACEKMFSDEKLQGMNLRYFDPTLSAADGHEDKGLIECLMVKCAKVLVYYAGDKETYGKDAEAAMALSQGKPVIFYCDKEDQRRKYKDIHPLTRLIDFETGVAVGVMVATSLEQVSELLHRIFENKMEYSLEHPKPGYYRLHEKLTNCVVRLQTNDTLLRETFWNYYHNRPKRGN